MWKLNHWVGAQERMWKLAAARALADNAAAAARRGGLRSVPQPLGPSTRDNKTKVCAGPRIS